MVANEIRINALLHALQFGIDLEGGSGNSFHAHIAPYRTGAAGIRTAGQDNYYEVDVGGGIFPFGPGAIALPASKNERFLFRRNQGQPPFIDQGKDNRVL